MRKTKPALPLLASLMLLGCGGGAIAGPSSDDPQASAVDASVPPAVALATVTSSGPASVLTWHNDNAHSGANTSETTLTTTNVAKATFGKLFSVPVDDFMYAQPLYVPAVSVAGTPHNMVFAATMSASVYGFDADTAGAPIWHDSFANPGAGVVPVPAADVGNGSDVITPNEGILGTPVIDAATSTLYVVVNTREGNCPSPPTGCTYPFRLHALDLATGVDKVTPKLLKASVPGTGGGSKGGTVEFKDFDHMQRPGLTLYKGIVYIAIGSHGDDFANVYHGWILGYRASTLDQTFVFNATPNDLKGSGGDRGQGAFWQTGASVAVDSSGFLYAETANGLWDGVADFGDSLLKLGPGAVLSDWFTPSVQSALNGNDVDLGSAGPVILPDQTGAHPHEVVATGKPGVLYLVDRDDMGHYDSTTDQIVETVNVDGLNTTNVTGGIFATPAFWNGSLYIAGVGDNLKAFSVSAGSISVTPTSKSGLSFPYPGATPAVSSNGTTNGIVWAIQGAGYSSGSPAVLRAYDATNLGTLLYSSNQSGTRDTAGGVVKFTTPTVANGKVYIGTVSELDVYGLL